MKVNGQAKDWEKIFTEHTSHKGLFLRIIMNFDNSIIKRQTLLLNMGKHFTKKNI